VTNKEVVAFSKSASGFLTDRTANTIAATVTNQIPQEFLSKMLGANRKSVTMAAQALQSAGLISYAAAKSRLSIAPASKMHPASATPSSRSGSMHS
jgi:hypothetical protein